MTWYVVKAIYGKDKGKYMSCEGQVITKQQEAPHFKTVTGAAKLFAYCHPEECVIMRLVPKKAKIAPTSYPTYERQTQKAEAAKAIKELVSTAVSVDKEKQLDRELVADGWKYRSFNDMWVHADKSFGFYVSYKDAKLLNRGKNSTLLWKLRADFERGKGE
jgi:hypothetical protein